jgi:hypothetical protein
VIGFISAVAEDLSMSCDFTTVLALGLAQLRRFQKITKIVRNAVESRNASKVQSVKRWLSLRQHAIVFISRQAFPNRSHFIYWNFLTSSIENGKFTFLKSVGHAGRSEQAVAVLKLTFFVDVPHQKMLGGRGQRCTDVSQRLASGTCARPTT